MAVIVYMHFISTMLEKLLLELMLNYVFLQGLLQHQ